MRAQRTSGPAETEAVGERLAADLRPGDVVLVTGELGAGKTTLIRGVCRALGVTDQVVSPTFTIGRRYSGRLPVSHLDLYRLMGAEGEEPGLLDDFIGGEAIALVEWPAAEVLDLPDDVAGTIAIQLRHLGGDDREIVIGDREEP